MSANLLHGFVAAGLLSMVALPALAETFPIGFVPPAPGAYTNVVSHDQGSFLDTYSFTVTNAGNSWPVAIASTLDSTPLYFNINALTVYLRNSNNQVIAQSAPGETASLARQLSPGSYTFEVGGTATGAFGGRYAFAVSAIPEPASYALALVGLGAVMLRARRARLTA